MPYNSPMIWANMTFLILGNLLLLILGLSSIMERSWRAVGLSFVGLGIHSAVWGVFLEYSHIQAIHFVNISVLILLCGFIGISLFRHFPRRYTENPLQIQKYDERDHMFARNNTWDYPETAEQYYREHPDKQAVDEKILQRPKLGKPGGKLYHDYLTPVADEAFDLLDRSRHLATGNPAMTNRDVTPETMSRIISKIATLYGAVDVGITPLRDHHLYSHAGRQIENWGQPIKNHHRTAIVIVVAMDFMTMKEAPAAPIMVESSRQYVESAKIAHLIAAYLRRFGYGARSHVDGNYELFCVPLAQDAGMGRVGRMGIFMHRIYGPCVRLSVVTTDMELTQTNGEYIYMDWFCDICKKCADNCPTGAIPPSEMPESRGFRHWSIQQESCYGYWRNIGTDCGFCIRVCPFTKPNTLVHRMARWYVSRNRINQRLALLADDILYGRKIKMKNNNPRF